MIFDELRPGKSIQNSYINIHKSDIKHKKFLYLVAGIKGNCIEGIYVLEKLYHWLSHCHEMKDLPIIVIPTLNVDGYQKMTCNNALGVDLYEEFSTPPIQKESKFLSSTLKKYPPSTFIYFSTGRPPSIEFSPKGKKIANLIAKSNFYDLEPVRLEDQNLPRYISEEKQSSYIQINFPKISKELTLSKIWEHNEKGLKDLIMSEVFQKEFERKKKFLFS